MRFVKKVTINAPASKVWRVFADEFDDAYKWMASIPHSYGNINGKQFEGAKSAGRVCEIGGAPDKLKASEKFLAYDQASRTCTVQIDFENTPVLFPVKHNIVDFSVVAVGDNQSEVSFAFRSNIKAWAYLIWPLIRLGFGVFVGQIVEELKYYVEKDAPHPRKLKALEKAKLAA